MRHSNPKIEVSDFDQPNDKNPALLFTLENSNGVKACICNFGGIVQRLEVPDKNGAFADVVLGFNNIPSYLSENSYAGAIVGRIAGRLTNGRFSLDGENYQLAQNERTAHLHGGIVAMDKQVWNHEIITKNGCEILKLSYLSPHNEEGYPGNVSINVYYSLTEQDGLKMEFEATTDRATPLCLTNHSYFNLAGEGNGDTKNHSLWIGADSYHSSDDNLCFLGKRVQVDSANDFRKHALIADRYEGIKQNHGDMYINDNNGDLRKVAEAYEAESRRVMEVFTTQDCTQFYTGKYLNTTSPGKSGVPYGPYAGFCLECQGFPDAPNHEGFKSIMLTADEVYKETIEYRFSVKD